MKIYFIIEQQIARHFVQYSEFLSNPPQILKPFIIQRPHPITIKGRYLANREIFIPLNVPLV